MFKKGGSAGDGAGDDGAGDGGGGAGGGDIDGGDGAGAQIRMIGGGSNGGCRCPVKTGIRVQSCCCTITDKRSCISYFTTD